MSGDSDLVRAARDFLGEVEAVEGAVERMEASGWLVVCIDLESDDIVGAYGPFETPEQALIESGRHQATSLGELVEPGEAGWRHVVKPLFPPVRWRR